MPVLERIRQAGVSLRAEGDKIIASPKGAVTEELRALMRAHKAELLQEFWQEYTDADLAEIDRLIVELCHLEGRSVEELDALLDERRRMAPVNVKKALAALRIATREALAPWPERPAKRAQITLCELVSKRRELIVLDGKANLQNQAKTLDSGKEAA
jgi:hypothetical protein